MMEEGYGVGVLDERHSVKNQRSLHESIKLRVSWMSNQVRVGFLSRQDEKLLSRPEMIMVSYKECILALFLGEARFPDQVQSMLGYYWTLKLE